MQDVDFAKDDLKLVHWHHIGADILPIEASKARGITDVCSYYGVKASECMAFGDGMNDLEMFDLVGYAVAMGDAQPDLLNGQTLSLVRLRNKEYRRYLIN